VTRRTTAQVEKSQRDYFLRLQLQEIRRQLGEEDPQGDPGPQLLDRATPWGSRRTCAP